MGALDAAMGLVASSLISAFGANATLSVPTSTYDPATGNTTVTAATTYPIVISPPYPFSKHEINGTAIKATDLKTLVARADVAVTPERNNSVLFKSVTYRIVEVVPIMSGELVAAFELQLRA